VLADDSTVNVEKMAGRDLTIVCDRQAYGQIDRQKCCVSICAVLMHDTKSSKDYNVTDVVCDRLIKIHNFYRLYVFIRDV